MLDAEGISTIIDKYDSIISILNYNTGTDDNQKSASEKLRMASNILLVSTITDVKEALDSISTHLDNLNEDLSSYTSEMEDAASPGFDHDEKIRLLSGIQDIANTLSNLKL